MIKKNVLRNIIIIFEILIMLVTTGCGLSDKTASAEQTELPPCTVRLETLTEKITGENDVLVYTISCTYPIINSTTDNNAADELNKKFKTEAESFVTEIKESGAVEKAKSMAEAAAGQDKDFYPHSSTINYTLQYNDNNIVSFLKTREDYTGGTSRTYYSEGETYNMETGHKYELSEVFEAKNAGLIKILQNGFKTEIIGSKEIFEGKTDFTEEEISANMDNLKWYLSSDGMIFFFNPNTIISDINEILRFQYNYTGNKSMFKIPV